MSTIETYNAAPVSTSMFLPHQEIGADVRTAGGQYAIVIDGGDDHATAIIGSATDLRWIVSTLADFVEKIEQHSNRPLEPADFIVDADSGDLLCPRCNSRFMILNGPLGPLVSVLAKHAADNHNPPI